MTQKLSLALIALPTLLCTAWLVGAPEKTHKLTTVSTRKMADSLHAVITADQRAYVEAAMQRRAGASQAARLVVDEMPSHAALLRTAAQSIQKRGAEFSYTLRSLTPISANNGPQTEAEQAGLDYVAKRPDENYYTEEELGGRAYFTAVYAERATLSSCVECHNANRRSPRRDFKIGDVMGGIVVRVPLEF